MATENLMDLSISKGDLRKEYNKLNGIESKLFNNNVFIALKNSVIEDDTIQFRKYVELLEVINKSDEKNGLKTSFDIDCPMYRANVLLLSCEHKAYKIFDLIISNYCNILNFSKIPISPCDENAEGNNAYYYLIRLNKIDKLKDLIEKWPLEMGQGKVDQSLSKAYFKLLIQNVYLEDSTKYYIEFILNKIRLSLNVFGKNDKPKYTFKDIKRRSYIIIDAIKTAIGVYGSTGTTKVDEKCLYIFQFIAVNIGVLKRMLNSTYDRLPWEEIEFCLVMYIKNFQCPKGSSFYYRAHLNCDSLLRYLDAFCIEFENVLNALKESDLLSKNDFNRNDIIKDIEMKNSIFKNLYETFKKLRDYYSIGRLIFYLSTIKNIENDRNDVETRIAMIERCLQILIETMKNTPTSPNLSMHLNLLISSYFSDNLQKTIKEMKISISQTYALRRRINLKNFNNFFSIKNDLIKIYNIANDIYTRLQINTLQDLFDAILTKGELKVKDICEIFNYGLIELKLLEETSNLPDKYTEIMQNLSKLKGEIQSNDQTLKLLFDELYAIIKENNDKLSMTQMSYNSMLTAYSRILGIIRDMSLSKKENDFYDQLCKSVQAEDTFRKPESVSSLDMIRVSELLEQIVYHATNCMPKLNIKEINRSKYRILNLMDINGCTQIHNELNEIFVKIPFQELKDNSYLRQVLEDKIKILRTIFKNYGVEHSVESIKMFINVYGNTAIFNAIEMILFDLLSIYENNLLSNVDLYDLDVPIVLGKELREYLAHDRCLVHLLSTNIELSIIMNCITFMNGNINIKSKGLNKSLNMNEIEEKHQCNLTLIDRKIKFFNFLKNKKLSVLKKDMNIDVLSRDVKGLTVLHVAARNAYLDVFKYLLNKIDDYDFLSDRRNTVGQTLLHVTSYSNNIELLKYLLLHHPNLEHSINDFDNNQFIAVHYASAFGTAEMIYEFMIRNSSCICIEDGRSRQAINIAMHFNNMKTFRAIFDSREEIFKLRPFDHHALLHFAAQIGNIDFMDVLLDQKVGINETTADGWTLLHTASFFGNDKIVKQLLTKGADINARTLTDNCTPIYYAVLNGNDDTTKFLLENDAFVHDVNKKNGFTLLHAAASNAKADMIEDLIKHGVNLYAVSNDGQTALHLASKANNIETVKMLLQYNADVNCVDKFNCTPLHYAAQVEDARIFEMLLKYFASISIVDSVHHRTPVQAALQNGQKEKIQCMIDMNINFYIEENWKYAILSGNINVVDTVLKKCSQNYIHKHWQKLCELLSMAIQRKDNEIAMYLITNCMDVLQYEHKLKIKPLHVAIFTLNLEITKILLEKYIETDHQIQECFEIVSNFLSILKYDTEKANVFVEIVKIFIKYANMHEHGPKLLQHCIMNNDLESIRVLIKSGVPISYKIIARAAMKSNSDIVKALIETSEVDGNTKELYSITLLHLVANNCNSSVVKYLIMKGCDVNTKDDTNYTPIDYATMAGKVSNIEVLLQHGAKFNKTLHIAVENDFTGIAYMLLKYGADVNCIESDGIPLQSAMRFGSQGSINLLLNNDNIDLNMHDGNKMSPLHIAAHFGDLYVTKALIEMGADVNAIDFEGAKPIHRALLESNLNIMKYYLNHNYIEINETTSDNFTLLHYAASRNNMDATRFLLEKGANVNSKDVNGETPLHIAAMCSSKEICDLLLNAGAKYNCSDKLGRWPYHVSKDRIKRNFILINTLFRYVYDNDKVNLIGFIGSHRNSLNFNCFNEEGKSVLHVAIASGSNDIVTTLLQYNVNVNLNDSELNTPLHYAAKLNNLQLVEELLSNGAIYCFKNIENLSPSDVTSDPEIKICLTNINKYFIYAEEDSSEFLTLLKNIGSHEEMKKVLFGPRNCANQTLYTYVYEKNGQDMMELIECILNKDVVHILKKADVFTTSGDPNEAFTLLNNIAIRYETLYGWSNPLTLNIQSALAKILYRLGEYEQCLSINQKILEEQLKNHDKNDNIILKLRCFSGLVLYSMGRYEAALVILEAVCNSQVNIFGHMHDEVLNTKRHIGWVLLELGKCDDSLKLYYEIYQAYKERYGENYQTTLIIATNIGMVLYRLTKYTESLKFYEFVYKKYVVIHGIEHYNSLRTLRSIANILAQTRRYDEALQKLNTVYEMQKNILGDMHDDTLQTQQDISVILGKHGAAMIKC